LAGAGGIAAPSGSAHPSAAALRRASILRATVDVIDERGFADASVALVLQRARVSRATFNGLFAGLEDCVGAVLEETLAHASALIEGAFAEAQAWQDGMRATLAGILGFLDADPALARVLIVQTLAGGATVLEHRERTVEAFRDLVVGRIEGEVPHSWPLAAEGMLASVLGLVHARLSAEPRQPLLELLGPLMGMLVAPYSDPGAQAREIQRCETLADTLAASTCSAAATDPPPLLRDPRSCRLRACMDFIAAHPGCSNREIAGAIGVTHSSRISALLARLAGEQLVAKSSEGPGRRNRWRLTDRGRLALGAPGIAATVAMAPASARTANGSARRNASPINS